MAVCAHGRASSGFGGRGGRARVPGLGLCGGTGCSGRCSVGTGVVPGLWGRRQKTERKTRRPHTAKLVANSKVGEFRYQEAAENHAGIEKPPTIPSNGFPKFPSHNVRTNHPTVKR